MKIVDTQYHDDISNYKRTPIIDAINLPFKFKTDYKIIEKNEKYKKASI